MSAGTHRKFVASQFSRFAIDLWLLLPIAVVVLFLDDVLKMLMPERAACLLAGGASFFSALLYIRFVKPRFTELLSPEHLGRKLAEWITWSAFRRSFDPTARLFPFVSLCLLALGLWITIAALDSLEAGLLIFVAGIFLGVATANTATDLYIGRRTTESVSGSGLRIVAILTVGILFAAIIELPLSSLLVLTWLLGIISWSAFKYSVIALQRIAREQDHVRMGDRQPVRRSGLASVISRLPERGVPVRFVLAGFRAVRYFAPNNQGKEMAKATALILSVTHHTEEVIQIARKYNERFKPSGPDYSNTLVNYEALSLQWQGRLKDAEATIRAAIEASKEPNEYLNYTLARILWQTSKREESLVVLEGALEVYADKRKSPCLPGTARKAHYLCEIALDQYLENSDRKAFSAALEEAYRTIRSVSQDPSFRSTHDVVHNLANLWLLLGAASEDEHERLCSYRKAAEHLLWCVARGSHQASRIKIALLHAIGTKQYYQARAYLMWTQDTIKRTGYSLTLPFPRQVDALLRELEEAERKKVVLGPEAVLLQGMNASIGKIGTARHPDRAERFRKEIFKSLSVTPKGIPIEREIPILSFES